MGEIALAIFMEIVLTITMIFFIGEDLLHFARPVLVVFLSFVAIIYCFMVLLLPILILFLIIFYFFIFFFVFFFVFFFLIFVFFLEFF